MIRVEPLANFPIERDLVTVVDDFIDKLKRVKPYLIPKEDKPISEGEYKQTPAQLMKYQAVHDVHQLHAVLRRLSASTRLHAEVPRSGGDHAGAPLQPGFARRRAR